MQLSLNHRQGTNIKALINHPQTNGSCFSPLMESITQNVIIAICAITFFNAFVPSFGLVWLGHACKNSTVLYFVSFYGSRSCIFVYTLVHRPHHWWSIVFLWPPARKGSVGCHVSMTIDLIGIASAEKWAQQLCGLFLGLVIPSCVVCMLSANDRVWKWSASVAWNNVHNALGMPNANIMMVHDERWQIHPPERRPPHETQVWPGILCQGASYK